MVPTTNGWIDKCWAFALVAKMTHFIRTKEKRDKVVLRGGIEAIY